MAGLDAEQPAGRGVVVVAMVGSTKVAAGREALDALGLAQQTARAEGVRQWPSNHVEDGGRMGQLGRSAAIRRLRDEVTRPTGSCLANVAATIAIGMTLLEATTRRGVVSAVDVESAKGRRGAGWVITLIPIGRFFLAAFCCLICEA